ncbi:MAG: LD-carboxypeptidase [Pseudomonadota bacterium]|nr:LD-carboxypeptidase [Burkholderiaceae bacterium]MDQ3445310.1 LD-carboxypeptidase [Pseudomonadota bacterium]
MPTTLSKRVGIVAPSGFVPDPAAVDRAAALFSARGWTVEAGESVFAREQRFAGTDALRLADLQRFATDVTVTLVVSARGGYGISRLLDRIDFAAIKARRPLMVGYSDFTAFNLAYLARGGVSFAGPCAIEFGAPEPSAFTIEHFFGLLNAKRYAIELELVGPRADISGRLWGGTLAMVVALLGTPYFPRVRGGILFLEDVNEPAYKVERMFYQLAHAGVLQRQTAIVLGNFSPITPMPNDNGFNLDAVLARLRGISGVPVFTGLPFGHSLRKLTLPVGGHARLVVKRGGDATLELSRYPNLV